MHYERHGCVVCGAFFGGVFVGVYVRVACVEHVGEVGVVFKVGEVLQTPEAEEDGREDVE